MNKCDFYIKVVSQPSRWTNIKFSARKLKFAITISVQFSLEQFLTALSTVF
ncbi:MAG TPA: hypothetical protein PLM75_02310 [bacterium]|nr:hypothetical protein [bacterium]